VSLSDELTVVILTLNEEDRIGRALESILIPARVVIIDSYSSDQTIERAQQLWRDLQRAPELLATVQAEWQGFTRTRNESLRWVQTPWVLWLDADEWLSPELCEELLGLNKLPQERSVFRIPRQSFFLGKKIRHGGWYPDRKSRLARTARVEWRSGPGGADVHEDLFEKEVAPQSSAPERHLKLLLGANKATDKGTLLQGHIYHQSFRNVQEQEETNRRYSTLLAEGLAQSLIKAQRRPPSALRIYVKTLVKFFENYIFKLGFLDGWPGFVIARGSAYSLYMRLKKTRELMSKELKCG